MKSLKTIIFLSLLFSVSLTCQYNNKNFNSYNKEIAAWRETRIERLKSKTGWLNLAGLYWLKEGENTFGSDSSNSIIFPPNSIPYYGSILKKGDSILLKVTVGVEITIDGKAVTEILLSSDAKEKPSIMESGSLAWYIIQRDDRYGIRLRDYNHPRISGLNNIPCFETSPEWRIIADFIPYETIRKIETATMIGSTEISNCPGELFFKKGLHKYKLLPFTEGNEFFIIYADKTNGLETYGNGRYMYTSGPDSSNKVILDFNKAYNPPCAFSPYATCPMPPRENILDLKIEAGEKDVHLIDHW